MAHTNHIKRFCAIGNTGWLEKHASVFNDEASMEMDFTPFGMENIELYKSNDVVLVIIDVTNTTNLSELKNALNTYKKESPQVVFFRAIINLAITSSLDRIFQKIPLPKNNSIRARASKRMVMTLELVNDQNVLNNYIKQHRPESIWPQILKNMDTMGIKDMEIYLHNYQAYLLMELPIYFNMEKEGLRWAELPKEKAWQNHVAQFQKVDSNSNAVEKWQSMRCIKRFK